LEWLQTLAGAFVGTLLGAIASYRLWLFQRARERKSQRTELVRALKPLLARIDRRDMPDAKAGPYKFIDPIPLELLDQLLQIATDEGGEFLDATVAFRVHRDKFNSLAGVANSARARGPLPAEIEEVVYRNLVERQTWLIEAGDRVVTVADPARCGFPGTGSSDVTTPSVPGGGVCRKEIEEAGSPRSLIAGLAAMGDPW
jgi:hypothetical protein